MAPVRGVSQLGTGHLQDAVTFTQSSTPAANLTKSSGDITLCPPAVAFLDDV